MMPLHLKYKYLTPIESIEIAPLIYKNKYLESRPIKLESLNPIVILVKFNEYTFGGTSIHSAVLQMCNVVSKSKWRPIAVIYSPQVEIDTRGKKRVARVKKERRSIHLMAELVITDPISVTYLYRKYFESLMNVPVFNQLKFNG